MTSAFVLWSSARPFMFGRLLGPHAQNLSLVRTSQLSWKQLADNNVIFVGVQNLFFNQLRGPIEPQLIPELEGIRNVNPAPASLPCIRTTTRPHLPKKE